MTAFMPEPQTLLMVVQGSEVGRPAASTAWRAGACPTPAGSTQPRIASLKSSPFTSDCSTAAAIAAAASCGELNDLNWPWKAPIGVRLAATMTTGSEVLFMGISFVCQVALLGGHANGTIDADDFTVEVGVVDDVRHESGEFVGLAQA